jgi:hypothetical protein
VPFVSSDPNAWMRPYFGAVASNEGFADLAIPLRFTALIGRHRPRSPHEGREAPRDPDLASRQATLGALRAEWETVARCMLPACSGDYLSP